MIVIALSAFSARVYRIYLFEQDVVTVGSRGNIAVPMHDLEAIHMRLERRGTSWWAVALDGTITYDGTPIHERAVSVGDRIECGDGVAIAIARVSDIDETVERKLLDATLRNESGAASVYADWLEAKGELRHAELVRSSHGR